jgi:hypothetical protein
VIQEVAALPDGFTDDNLRKCKLLNNVLTETLRIRPPIGQSLLVLFPKGELNYADITSRQALSLEYKRGRCTVTRQYSRIRKGSFLQDGTILQQICCKASTRSVEVVEVRFGPLYLY